MARWDGSRSASVPVGEHHRASVVDTVGADPPPGGSDLADALEAVCFVLSRGLSIGEAARILDCRPDEVRSAAETLAARLRSTPLMLQRHGEEVQLVTRPEVAWAVQRALNPERPGRLSRAALETLAIVAYRQPITRAAIEAIRGVSCDAVLENLERRELITEVGRQDAPGHPRLFGTTLRFLQVVGLERIEDLPPLAEGTTIPALATPGWPGASSGDGDGRTQLPSRPATGMAASVHDHQGTPAGAAGLDPLSRR